MPDGTFEPSSRTVTVTNLPMSAVPVDVEEFGDTAWKLLNRTSILAPTPTPAATMFPEFIDSLPPWEVNLLRHTVLFVDPRMTCFSLQPQFFAGCDGSAKFGNQGAFGWSVSMYLEERAASGMGPSRGAVMDSYRAECSGLLSILRFLIRLAESSDMFEDWSGVIGTNSQSMLDRLFCKPVLAHTTQPPTLTALDSLFPEWDLLVEIQSSLRILFGVSVVYVQAHQDDKRPVDQLPLMAQLNVEADALATQYQQQHGYHRPQVLMSPSAGVHLVSASGTITSKYKEVVLKKSTSPDLRQYIQEKNSWTPSTMDMVNWLALGKAFCNQISRRIHLSKLLHECLPTFHQLNKYGGSHRPCPACLSPDETRDYILRCLDPPRVEWRRHYRDALAKFHAEYRTAPLLVHALKLALEEWFQSTSDIEVSPVLYPKDVRHLVIQQNAIGWRQLFNVRFTVEWAKLQQEYYSKHRKKQDGNKRRRDGSQWQVKLIVLMWDQWRLLWSLRNSDVHGKDSATRARAERAATARDLREVYDQRQHLEPQVASLLHEQEHEHRRPLSMTRNWIAVNLPIVRRSVRRVKNHSARGTQSLRTYFASVASDE